MFLTAILYAPQIDPCHLFVLVLLYAIGVKLSLKSHSWLSAPLCGLLQKARPVLQEGKELLVKRVVFDPAASESSRLLAPSHSQELSITLQAKGERGGRG